MKKLIGIIIFFSIVLWSCDDMNSVNQEWLERGETIYTGTVDSLKILPGNNRLWLVWQMNADPRITELVISWNNKQDSLILPVVRDTEEKIGFFRDSVLIDKNLEEGAAVFYLHTRDNEGHSSIVQEVTADVYGPNYAESISFRMPRKVTSMKAYEGEDIVELTFEKQELTDIKYTELIYTTYKNSPAGEKKTIIVDNATTSVVLEDINLGDEISMQSMFVPTSDAIDIFPGKKAVFHLPLYYLLDKERWESVYHDQYIDISKSGWTAWASTEELEGEGDINGRAATIIDDNYDTFWHSVWKTTPPQLPHIIEVDMKSIQTIYSFELCRRKGNKDLKTVEVEMSLDDQNWKQIGSMTFSADANENSLIFMFKNPVMARYLRMKITESNNERHASISEIVLTGSMSKSH